MSNPLDSILPPEIRQRLAKIAEAEHAEDRLRHLWASRLGKFFGVLVALFLIALLSFLFHG